MKWMVGLVYLLLIAAQAQASLLINGKASNIVKVGQDASIKLLIGDKTPNPILILNHFTGELRTVNNPFPSPKQVGYWDVIDNKTGQFTILKVWNSSRASKAYPAEATINRSKSGFPEFVIILRPGARPAFEQRLNSSSFRLVGSLKKLNGSGTSENDFCSSYLALVEAQNASASILDLQQQLDSAFANISYTIDPNHVPVGGQLTPTPISALASTDFLKVVDAPNLQSSTPSIVAVLDSGVNEFTNLGISFIDTNKNDQIDASESSDIGDPINHGTLIAKIISLIAKPSRIYSIRVCDKNSLCRLDNIIQGICWISNSLSDSEKHKLILNMSFSGSDASSALSYGIQYIISQGALVTASAGNRRSNPPSFEAYPGMHAGSLTGLISVTGFEINKSAIVHSLGSNQAITPSNSWITIAAPFGVPLIDTAIRCASATSPTPNLWCGTSFSNAYVAAALAILRARYPSDSPQMTAQRLRTCVRGHWNKQWGEGPLNFAVCNLH